MNPQDVKKGMKLVVTTLHGFIPEKSPGQLLKIGDEIIVVDLLARYIVLFEAKGVTYPAGFALTFQDRQGIPLEWVEPAPAPSPTLYVSRELLDSFIHVQSVSDELAKLHPGNPFDPGNLFANPNVTIPPCTCTKENIFAKGCTCGHLHALKLSRKK